MNSQNIAHYKNLLEKGLVPAGVDQRKIALDLYRMGEEDFAVDYIIKQMNRYKDSNAGVNMKRETCMAAAITLGRLGDERAIDALFESLGEINRFASAYALALINGPIVEKRLLEIASIKDKKGIQAAVALGLLKSDEAVALLIGIIEHISQLKEKYDGDIAMDMLDNFVLASLGLYEDNEAATNAFIEYLSKRDILLFLSDYVEEEAHPGTYMIIHEIGWKIVKKFGWNQYINSSQKREACAYTSSDSLTEALRAEVVDAIWRHVGKN